MKRNSQYSTDSVINVNTEILISSQYNKVFYMISFMLFIIFNTIKLCVFNFSILYSVSNKIIIYKFFITIAANIIIFLLIISRKKRRLFVFYYVMESVYIIGVLTYMTYLHGYFHLSELLSLSTEGREAAAKLGIKGFMNFKLFIVLIDLPLFFYMVYRYSIVSNISKAMKNMRRILLLLSILLIVAFQVRDYKVGQFITQKYNDYWTGETFMIERYGTLLNSIMDLFIHKDDTYLEGRLKYGKEINSDMTSSEKPNFVIIQVESMSANIVNEKHNGQYVTPFLHSLEDNSIYYPYIMSYHKGGGTSDAEFSIINSVETLDEYPAIKISDYDYPNSFVKDLKKSAYDIVAFHGNEGSYYNRNVAFSRMGFDKFIDLNSMGMKQTVWGLPDNKVLDYTYSYLKKEDNPFFSYTITMTSHTPFDFAAQYGYNNGNYDDINDKEVKGYFNSFSYVDKSIEEFVNNIRNNFSDTYIIIYGDHTPGIDKDDYKSSSVLYDSKYFEFVPLFILTPNNQKYKEEKKVGSFLDMAPTILNAAKQPYSIKSDGDNLLNIEENGGMIPFKGGTYSRTELFKAISDVERKMK